MKLKARIFVGALTFLMSACAFMSTVGAMNSQRPQRRDSLHVYLAGYPNETRRDMAFNAIRKGDAEAIRLFFSLKRDDINVENGVGDTLLLAAAKDGCLPCMIALLKYSETNMDALTTDGKTMWHILLENNKWGAVEHLLGVKSNSMVDPELIGRCKKNFNEFMKKIETVSLSDSYINTLRSHLPMDVVVGNRVKLRAWASY